MKTINGILFKTFILLFLSLFLSCGIGSHKKKYKIGFSQCTGEDQWRITMLKEMKRELSFHPGTEFYFEDAHSNSQTQVAQVKSMLKKNLDLLIISPNEAQPLTAVVEEAYNKGIPVIVVDRKIASNKYTAYVGADNFEIGLIAGNYIGSRLDKVKNIVEILGLPRSSPAIERQKGFANAIGQYPQLKVINQFYGNWLKEDASKQVEDHINTFEKADLVFAHNDQMALGIYQQLKKYNLQNRIKLIGVDALAAKNNGLDFVSNKILTASVLYPTGGKEAIRTAFAILNQQPFDKNNILKTLVVDSSNVQLMKMQEEKIDNQQQDIIRQQGMLDELQKVYRNQRFILNILVVSLVLAVVFGGIAFYSLTENWKTNKKLEEQNREILESEHQLRKMTAKATEANEAKIQFFTNVSHEFRTPISLMILPIEELLKEKHLPSEAKSKLLLLQKNTYRILKMVNELIDFRKIEYDKMQLNLSRVDIVLLINEVIQSFKDIAHNKQIDLRLISSLNNFFILLDIQLFEKILFNLIGNAIKFTPDYGRIYLKLSNHEDIIQLLIEDSGIGMSEEEQAHAFEPFYQGTNRNIQGSGLGLALCKQIIDLHQGSIELSSKKEEGTICKITLPIIEVDNCFQQNKFSLDEVSKLYIEETLPVSDSILENNPQKDKSILIIEDNDDLRNFLYQSFSSEYEVVLATDGKQGFEKAIDYVPDVIISDILMPIRGGLETARLLKEDLRTSHIPIILLTAKNANEQKKEGLDVLADVYMSKPFNLDILKATVLNVLANRDLLKQKYSSDLQISSSREINRFDKKFINDLASIVEENLNNEHFSVEEIGSRIGLSRVQLYRKTKALLNCSVAEYMLNRRLQKAKFLLLNEQELSITEITYQTGFSSPNYFSTVFKAKFGCKPTEFRKEKTTDN